MITTGKSYSIVIMQKNSIKKSKHIDTKRQNTKNDSRIRNRE